ncbi:hypothetical protein Dsin_021992 [Dipteronia sinensis]|uniref:Cyclic nucleotide-binding domain-containing protein n=1 Tax=Dipteronia sinensis TaxID=43782 RepID=A0AAE0A1N0_9ROSI|nr:hypothetical protein Dsin_021992 [Dipteronia sinensis]
MDASWMPSLERYCQLGDTKFLNDNCPKILKTEYAESYELGMFMDAFQFGIVDSKKFPTKFYIVLNGAFKILGKFENWSKASLFQLCDCLKPVIYTECTRMVCEGDRHFRPSFEVQGKLWNFTSDVSRENRTCLLKDGDFWGEEFVNLIQNDPGLLIIHNIINYFRQNHSSTHKS